MNSRMRSLALGAGLLMMSSMESNRIQFDLDDGVKRSSGIKRKTPLTATQAKKRKANKQAKKSRKANRK